MSLRIQAASNASNKLSLVDFVTDTMCHIRMSRIDGDMCPKSTKTLKGLPYITMLINTSLKSC